MLRVWNLSLVIATFSLTILGTFLTRSGVLASVHSFTESGVGPAILGFFAVIVAVSLALIAWRGDQLRSPGRIAAPVSREGAFLANNALFAAFAFVVLLGTVFPLLVEAFDGRTISVGNPYFDRMTRPIGLALLFVMAVAPMLPWGGASRRPPTELLGRRLLVPMWIAAAALVLAVAGGARGWGALLAFGLGGFAGGAALRQIVLAVRRNRWRGLVGRTNGGMIVHLGVVVVAVAFAASQSYVRQAEFDLEAGQEATFAGHEIVYLGSAVVDPREPHRAGGVRACRRRPDVRAGHRHLPVRLADDRDPVGALHPARRRGPVGADVPRRGGPRPRDPAGDGPAAGGVAVAGRHRHGPRHGPVAGAGRSATQPRTRRGWCPRGAAGVSDPAVRRRRAAWIALPVAVAIGLLVLVLATRDSASVRNASSPILGKLAPPVAGVTTAGEPFDLDDWRGRWVIVNFFQSTCVPCIMEHPELVAFSERHAPAGDAEVVSVVFDDSVDNVRRFFEANGGDWPVLVEGGSEAAIAYGVTGVPESYLVAPSGAVVWKQLGGVTADGIDNVIDRLTAGS